MTPHSLHNFSTEDNMINEPCPGCQAVHSFKHVMDLTDESDAGSLFAVSIEKRGYRERGREGNRERERRRQREWERGIQREWERRRQREGWGEI